MNKLPENIKGMCFNSFCLLNNAERAVVMYGEERYIKSLNLEDDSSPCWTLPSGEHQGFVGWNPQCIPTIEYIKWKLEQKNL